MDDTFNTETLKAICFLQAMSQDYFNTDYGVDGVAGGNTLRALNSALE
jgi:lysozyme family protein